ncbi:unnamed protein product [Calypogeia fissa]
MVPLLALGVWLSLCMMAVSSPVKEGEIPSETFVIQWETQPNLGLLARPGQVVEIGDFLHFKFTKTRKAPHSVLQVTGENLKTCNGSGAIKKYEYQANVGGVKIRLKHLGAHHFMCDHHCRGGLGQVLTVRVVPKGGNTPLSSPASAPVSPPTSAPVIAPAPGRLPFAPAPTPRTNGLAPMSIGKSLSNGKVPIKK